MIHADDEFIKRVAYEAMRDKRDALMAENQRLREALEEIAGSIYPVERRCVMLARTALAAVVEPDSADSPNATADCRHEWDWLTEVRYIADEHGRLVLGENVKCPLCGARGWAHGHNGNRPTERITITPTTKGR